MGYFIQGRGRFIVLCFIASSLLLAAFPGIDLYVSGLFYDSGFPYSESRLQKLIHDGTTYFVCASLAVVVATFSLNKLLRRNLLGVDGRKVCYLALVLVLGAGLIVNLTLKDNFGRARPRDIAQFGGSKSFAPAFVVGTECRKNCSFSSGEAAAGFFSIALMLALARRRRVAWLLAVALGALVSLSRIAAGAHFLSDTVVSFFVMLLVSDGLRFYMLDPGEHPIKPVALGEAAAARVLRQ